MVRLIAMSALAVVLLAACAPETEAPANDVPGEEAVAAPESVEPAAPVAEPEGFQLTYLLEEDNYTVQSDIDPAILAFDPALAYRLWTENKASLDALGTQADADKVSADKYAAESGEAPWFFGYTLEISQKPTLVLEDVISIEESVSTFTGGAHPNYFSGGSIYRKGVVEPLGLSTFITDAAAFERLVLTALVDEKVERGYAGSRDEIEASVREMLVPSDGQTDYYANRIVLLESTEAGKAGGLSVLFSPYDVGAYAEGAYTVNLPAAALAPMLTESWAGRFGGEPVLPETP